jgi:hypothetical protein
MHSSHFLRYESKIIFIVEVEVMKLDITYDENILSADDIILFQRKMGWTEEPKDQLTKSLSNTLFSVVAKKMMKLSVWADYLEMPQCTGILTMFLS